MLHHSIVFYNSEKWAAVPANNGGNGPSWQHGDTLLVGFTVNEFKKTERGHQRASKPSSESWLAHSDDGGENWHPWKPKGLNEMNPSILSIPSQGINFSNSGFVLRVVGNGYIQKAPGRWLFSEDLGRSWNGSFGFNELLSHPELENKEFTARTAYLVEGENKLDIFLSARTRDESRRGIALREKAFLARTTDGGKNFNFVSWIVPWHDDCRAIMPAPVRLSPFKIVVTLRRKSRFANWIDCYQTTDNGKSWTFLSEVGVTELGNNFNGNPPAMILMRDGRLCCVYGNRTERQIVARYSDDEGKNWSHIDVLRDDFHSANGWPDLGYPRLFQRTDGKLVTAYFWCTEKRPETHIEATIF
ncbi:MAG: exo-alpha-sialidase [Candidatus Hodarchaeota archaeon]